MNKKITSVAISPGSGKSMIEAALAKKADVLITGDIDHHDGIDAPERGMAVIDAGHWGLEKIFIPYMQDYLEEQIEGITVVCDESESPFKII
jgi:putative NIF3 family GTP cyclohydrolase 1 type 2